MASRFEPVTDPDKAWEYRQAGVLYWFHYPSLWVPVKADAYMNRDRQASMMYDDRYKYAILVEEDDSPTTEDGDG